VSYDIDILDENGNVMICNEGHMLSGGTVRVDRNLERIPIQEASINITYNYYQQYKLIWEEGSLNQFDGKRAADIIPQLEEGITKLESFCDETFIKSKGISMEEIDYWTAAPSNACKALKDLKFLCEECPDGTIAVH